MSSLLASLHVLAAVVWVGGMFFAWVCLRPVAATLLEPPLRLTLWREVFRRFFPFVWVAVALLPITGYAMIFGWMGGMAGVRPHVHVMILLGFVMIFLFAFLYLQPYRKLITALDADDVAAGGPQLGLIRRIVGINLIIGLIVVAVAAGGRYLF